MTTTTSETAPADQPPPTPSHAANADQNSPQLPAAPPTLAAQLDQIQKWILTGASAHDIEEAIRQQWPSAKAPALLNKALDLLAKSTEADPDLILGFCLEATRDLYRQMKEIGDFHGALAAIKQLATLANVRA